MDADPAQSSITLQLLLIVILTLINAYFAASEMAIVSVNKNRIHRKVEEGNRKAMLVEKEIKNTFVFLAYWSNLTISYPLFRWQSLLPASSTPPVPQPVYPYALVLFWRPGPSLMEKRSPW